MHKLKNNESGSGIVEVIVLLVIVIAIVAVGWLVYRNHKKTTDDNKAAATSANKSSTTPSTSATKAQAVDQYAGWKDYSNSQVSFKYPGDWTASKGPGGSQSTIADATSSAFVSSAMTTSQNPGAKVTLYLQLSTDSLTIDCADAPCQVAAVTPLSNSQQAGAVLAMVNQTSGNGTKFTEYVVAGSGTKVGDTSVEPIKTGSSNVYVFGQPYYTPSDGGLTVAARVTDTATLQSDGHFKELVNLINSIKFN